MWKQCFYSVFDTNVLTELDTFTYANNTGSTHDMTELLWTGTERIM